MDKNYVVPDHTQDPNGNKRHQELNAKIFTALDYGTSNSTLRSKVNKYRRLKDGRKQQLKMVGQNVSSVLRESSFVRETSRRSEDSDVINRYPIGCG